MENRNGLIAAAMVTQADGYAEREAALLMLADKQEGRTKRITVGADKAYDDRQFVQAVRKLNVTPHIIKNDNGHRSNLDGRTTRHEGYAISLSCRWLVEKSFGWLKETGPVRQVKVRGLHKVDWVFVFSCAAHKPAQATEADRTTSHRRPRAAVRLKGVMGRKEPFQHTAKHDKQRPKADSNENSTVKPTKIQQQNNDADFFNKLLRIMKLLQSAVLVAPGNHSS